MSVQFEVTVKKKGDTDTVESGNLAGDLPKDMGNMGSQNGGTFGGTFDMDMSLDKMMNEMQVDLGIPGDVVQHSSTSTKTFSSSSSFSSSSTQSTSTRIQTGPDGQIIKSAPEVKVVQKTESASESATHEMTAKGGAVSESSNTESSKEASRLEAHERGGEAPKVITESSKDLAAEAKVAHTNREGDTHSKGEKYEFSEKSIPVGDGPNKVQSHESTTSYESDPIAGEQNRGKTTVVIPMKKI